MSRQRPGTVPFGRPRISRLRRPAASTPRLYRTGEQEQRPPGRSAAPSDVPLSDTGRCCGFGAATQHEVHRPASMRPAEAGRVTAARAGSVRERDNAGSNLEGLRLVRARELCQAGGRCGRLGATRRRRPAADSRRGPAPLDGSLGDQPPAGPLSRPGSVMAAGSSRRSSSSGAMPRSSASSRIVRPV